MKIYNMDKNVLDAARDRIALVFDNFEHVSVSVSSGKDSTALFHLCVQEAKKRKRKIRAFFLDQEAEYQASIEIIRLIMHHPCVIPDWFQVPVYLTNSTSYSEYFLYAWGEGQKWVRAKDPIAIHEIKEEYPKRFYKFINWYEKQAPENTAFLVGLRADESITRYRAVTKHPGWNDIKWGTMNGKCPVFYPIYDWTVYDVWKFIYDYDLQYNKIYDLMFLDNYSIYTKMRVSNLIHEKSYKCLVDLPRYEPDTYNALCKRVAGIATATRYAAEKQMFTNKKLPSHYKNWLEFRNFLLQNIPEEAHRTRFEKRFVNEPKNEKTYKAQVGQLLINDYENSRPYDKKREQRLQELKKKWRELL